MQLSAYLYDGWAEFDSVRLDANPAERVRLNKFVSLCVRASGSAEGGVSALFMGCASKRKPSQSPLNVGIMAFVCLQCACVRSHPFPLPVFRAHDSGCWLIDFHRRPGKEGERRKESQRTDLQSFLRLHIYRHECERIVVDCVCVTRTSLGNFMHAGG